MRIGEKGSAAQPPCATPVRRGGGEGGANAPFET